MSYSPGPWYESDAGIIHDANEAPIAVVIPQCDKALRRDNIRLVEKAPEIYETMRRLFLMLNNPDIDWYAADHVLRVTVKQLTQYIERR